MSAATRVDEWVDLKTMPFGMLMPFHVAKELAKRVTQEGGPELVTTVTRDGKPAFVMHPVLADVIRRWCGETLQVAKYMPELLEATQEYGVKMEHS
jgi:hypothetical protein